MEKIIENTWNMIKIIFAWVFVFLITGSFILNFWLAGIIHVDREIINEYSIYMKHRDSIQLELMDRLVNKNK